MHLIFRKYRFFAKTIRWVVPGLFCLILGAQTQPLKAQDFATHNERCQTAKNITLWQVYGGDVYQKFPQRFSLPSQNVDLNSYQSPSGKFLFWYALEGDDAIPAEDSSGSGFPDRVEIAALAADEAWEMLIQDLGYKDPVPADGTYDFYFANLGFYGQTSISDGKPFSIIDSRFDWVPGNDYEDDALGAMKVTIAHEFYHAVQFAYNDWNGPSADTDWLEMDAVNAEHVVFPEVSEYLNFLDTGSVFQLPAQSTPVAFHHTTWMMYFTERFGPDFFRDVWEAIQIQPELTMPEAIALVLDQLDTDYHTEVTRLYLWHMASGSWADPEYGFEHAARYPTSFKRTQRTAVPNEPYPMWNISGLAANFHAVIPSAQDVGEVVIAYFADNTESGIGLLAYFENGDIEERILPPVNDGYHFYRTGWYWEDIGRLGIATSNTEAGSSRLYQLMAGAGESIEQLRYGDVNNSGHVTVEDTALLLDFLIKPDEATLPLARRFAAEVSNNGSLTAYDAGLIYKKASGFMSGFPADLNESGFGPELSRFESDLAANAHPPGALTGGNPLVRLIPPEQTDGEELKVLVEVSGFPDEILSVELDVLFTSAGMSFSMVSQSGSQFDELVYSAHADGDALKTAWASNRYKSEGIVGSLVFIPEAEGQVFMAIERVLINEADLNFDFAGTSFVIEDNPAVPVESGPDKPFRTELKPNYPNPFNPETVIPFTLEETAAITLEVFDITGRRAAVLINNERLPAGSHQVRFDASGLSSGVYLSKLSAGGRVFTGRMVLVK